MINYEQLVAEQPVSLRETVNQSRKVMPVKLDDGSLVLLKTGSRISYPSVFAGSLREIYLNGEAFFDVTKNPDKPFIIYANGLVTKVLGTSFTIKAYPDDPHVIVDVKTGRVAVFARNDALRKDRISNRELTGVVLLPNQKIVFERGAGRMAKSLVENPQLLSAPTGKHPFIFDETPVSAVLRTLEKAYGVDIVYDEDVLSKCPLTATLTDQALFEKLDIICRVIDARYEVIDGQIIMYSQGCK